MATSKRTERQKLCVAACQGIQNCMLSTGLLRKTIKAMQDLLDDLEDTGEACNEETGKMYHSCAAAERLLKKLYPQEYDD